MSNTEKNNPENEKFIILPAENASQISDSQFEFGKNQTLIYLKFVSMNVNAIKAKNGRIEDVIGDSNGYLIFGDCDAINDFLIKSVNDSMKTAKQASQNNP